MQNYNLVIFILTEGHSYEIPRKLLRTLDGKALIQYPLSLAKRLASDGRVAVLTDDEEIELIAARQGVLCRRFDAAGSLPVRFGDGPTTAMLEEIENRGGPCEFVIWLGASFPLTRKRDIIQATEKLSNSPYDAIFSVSTESQRCWEYTSTYQPAFREVPNSFGTDVMHKEVGAFFIMKRSAVDGTGYVGRRGMPFFLNEAHAVEVRSFHDWWVAEKLLRRRQILFVVAGYPEIGMGHVYRTLGLAQELNDHEVQFLCTTESSLAVKQIADNLYPTFQQKEDEPLLTAVGTLSPDLVINDILDTPDEYIRGLRDQNIRIVNFEDQGPGAQFADLVINALYDEPRYPNMLAGHDYFCLRSEFLTAPKAPLRGRTERVLVTFGGTDQANLTVRCLTVLLPLAREHGFTIQLITGPGYMHRPVLEAHIGALAESDKALVEWVSDGTRKISEYMAAADIAVTSAGRTVYELAVVQVPTIIIAANDRETTHTFGLKAGMSFLGLHNTVSDAMIREEALRYITDYGKRERAKARLSPYDMSLGTKHVVARILDVLTSNE